MFQAFLLSILIPFIDTPQELPLLSNLLSQRVLADETQQPVYDEEDVPANATAKEYVDIVTDTSGTWSVAARIAAASVKLAPLVIDDTTYYQQLVELFQKETDYELKTKLTGVFLFMRNPDILDVYRNTVFFDTIASEQTTKHAAIVYGGLMANQCSNDFGKPYDRKGLIIDLLKVAKTDISERIRSDAVSALGDFVRPLIEGWVIEELENMFNSDSTPERIKRDIELSLARIQQDINICKELSLNIQAVSTSNLIRYILTDPWVLEGDTSVSYYTKQQRIETAQALKERSDAFLFTGDIISVAENTVDNEQVRAECIISAGVILNTNTLSSGFESRFISLSHDLSRLVRLAAISVMGDLGGEMSLTDLEEQLTIEQAKNPADSEVIESIEEAISKIKNRMSPVSSAKPSSVKRDFQLFLSGHTILLNRSFETSAFVDIYNLSGRRVSVHRLAPNTSHFQLPSSLAGGNMYLFRVKVSGSERLVYDFKVNLGAGVW